eukprot:3521935-Pyramimonas_sp.AAC.2
MEGLFALVSLMCPRACVIQRHDKGVLPQGSLRCCVGGNDAKGCLRNVSEADGLAEQTELLPKT